ncbi:lengsin-like [Haliotis rufescens]|uniref:lengsin-like n=1 Tax=Haliotis rufescens TaxID=6454 RepID=UPI00201F914E|nr:lengsin-like [Haliotis rufescens]
MSHINKYDYVRFSVADIHGRSRGRIVPARHVKKTFETGIGCNLFAVVFNNHAITYLADTDALKTRIKEHQSSVDRADFESAPSDHICNDPNNSIQWDKIKALTTSLKNFKIRKVQDLINIKKRLQPPINRDQGCYILPALQGVWVNVLSFSSATSVLTVYESSMLNSSSRGFLSFGLHKEVTCPSENMADFRAPKAYLRPDIDTLYNVSWSGQDDILVAEIICESYWLKDGSAQLACPRYVARQQLEKLTNHGFSLFSGYEVEFTLTQAGRPYLLEPDYMRHRLVSKHDGFLFYLEKHMHQAGVDIGSFHSEWGAGLFEMVLQPSYGIKSADSCITFKNGILEIGDKKDYSVCFNPMQGCGGVGMHFNHSLWSSSSGVNVFYDPDSDHGLSTLGRHWLAGLMKHAKALSAFFCPTINCYNRLHKPNLPGLIYWSTNKRSACVKVKSLEAGTYLENRIPSGMSNPYITLAATIAAGLDGIEKKLECPPVDQFSSSKALPHTLSEAINHLQVDTDMVHSLGKEFIEWFVCTLNTDIDDTSGMVCSGIK